MLTVNGSSAEQLVSSDFLAEFRSREFKETLRGGNSLSCTEWKIAQHLKNFAAKAFSQNIRCSYLAV